MNRIEGDRAGWSMEAVKVELSRLYPGMFEGGGNSLCDMLSKGSDYHHLYDETGKFPGIWDVYWGDWGLELSSFRLRDEWEASALAIKFQGPKDIHHSVYEYYFKWRSKVGGGSVVSQDLTVKVGACGPGDRRKYDLGIWVDCQNGKLIMCDVSRYVKYDPDDRNGIKVVDISDGMPAAIDNRGWLRGIRRASYPLDGVRRANPPLLGEGGVIGVNEGMLELVIGGGMGIEGMGLVKVPVKILRPEEIGRAAAVTSVDY